MTDGGDEPKALHPANDPGLMWIVGDDEDPRRSGGNGEFDTLQDLWTIDIEEAPSTNGIDGVFRVYYRVSSDGTKEEMQRIFFRR